MVHFLVIWWKNWSHLESCPKGLANRKLPNDQITDREKAEIVTAYNKMRLASPEEIPKSAKEGMAYLKVTWF